MFYQFVRIRKLIETLCNTVNDFNDTVSVKLKEQDERLAKVEKAIASLHPADTTAKTDTTYDELGVPDWYMS